MLRHMPLGSRLPREKDQHVPRRPLPRVVGHKRRQAVLALVVGDDQGVEGLPVLHPREAVLGPRLAVRDARLLAVRVQRRDAAPGPHVGAPEECGHGVVDAISVHALERWLSEDLWGRHRPQIEDCADPPPIGVVEVRAGCDRYLVQDHVLEQEQGLKNRVELQVVADLREMSELARVMSFEVFCDGKSKRLEFKAADVPLLRVETKAAIL